MNQGRLNAQQDSMRLQGHRILKPKVPDAARKRAKASTLAESVLRTCESSAANNLGPTLPPTADRPAALTETTATTCPESGIEKALRLSEIRRNPPRNMDLEEASAFLRISPSKLRHETARKAVKVARFGRKLVFRLQDIEAYQARLVS